MLILANGAQENDHDTEDKTTYVKNDTGGQKTHGQKNTPQGALKNGGENKNEAIL